MIVDSSLSSAKPAQPRGRLASIDFLRGAAALAVVFDHVIMYPDDLGYSVLAKSSWLKPLYAACRQGYLGVPLFFVLSGFCIHLRWAKRGQTTAMTKATFLDFWRRRFHRLYPPYFAALCLCMGLAVVAVRVGIETILTNYPHPRAYWMSGDFLSHVFMLHGLYWRFDTRGGNANFWTLAREEYFYLMYFALIPLRRWAGPVRTVLSVWAMGLVWTAVVILCNPDPYVGAVFYSSALALWIQWTLGMIAVEAYVGICNLPGWCSHPAIAVLWVVLAKVCEQSVNVYRIEWGRLFTPVLWGLAFFTILNYCVRLERAGRWPNNSAFRWLSSVGIFSYSLYLVHAPIKSVVKQVMGPLKMPNNALAFLAGTALLTASCYFGAKAFFHLIESRFLNSDKRVAARTMAAASAAAN